MKKIILLITSFLLLTGCSDIFTDNTYTKAKCNDTEYDIIAITRWSESNYELKLRNGEKIEVHPMNCIFYR